MRYLLTARNTLLVRGPASIQLREGEANVLGAPLKRDLKLVVRHERQLPVESNSDVDLEISLGESASVFEVEGSTIPTSWNSAADALAEMEQGKVMIIGATDGGKSTLCTYLANELLSRGLTPRIVDADIGQADIGPPTTVSTSTPPDFLTSLVDLKPQQMIFIGHTSPSQVESKLIDGTHRLAFDETRRLTIVNTDGWVLDPAAILYKIKLIERLQPDLVIGISTGSELQPILSGSKAQSMKVQAPETVLSRSRTDRREIRIAGYRRFLDGGRIRTFVLRDVKLSLPRELPSPQNRGGLDFKNLIIGLLNEEGYLIQIGVLMQFSKDSLRAYSRPAQGVREIELGWVRLSIDGTELGYLDL